MISGWRIVRERLRDTAFSGIGARQFGGRWNSPGTSVVYTSQSLSLAALEVLVHFRGAEPAGVYVFFEARWQEGLVEELSEIPHSWRLEPPAAALQIIGDEWVRQGRSAVLSVPSAVVPQERNYLLNPAHPDFPRIEISAPQPFVLDPRLRS